MRGGGGEDLRKNPVIDLCLEDDQAEIDGLKVYDENDDELAPRRGLEEQQLEVMMASGGDYSPNSHTFFKQPVVP
jgi:hypothetical protein